MADTVALSRPAGGTLPEIIDREAQRKAHRRLVRAGVVFALALAGAASYFVLRPKPLPFAARFRVEAITHGPVVREVRATGHVEALSAVQIGAEISGRVATVEVDFNQHVHEGHVLARFDRAALEAQLAQTRAALATARMLLEQAKTERAQAERNRARNAKLHSQQVLSDADRDLTEANARLADQRVQAADSQLAAQRAAYALARTNLDHALIRSPIDGIVVSRNVDPGQTVASALQAPTLFVVAADLRRMRVIAAVDEADIGELQRRQLAKFTVTAYPDRVFEGVVVEVRNSPTVIQDVVTYAAVLEADNLDLALKPGMTASTRIRTATQPEGLRVPNNALRFLPPHRSASNATGVWMLDGNELRFVRVRAGISDGELTAIESGELAPGGEVVVELTPAGRMAYGIAH